VDEDYGDMEEVHSWGGELDFNLNPGPGISPHLIIGGGNLDYRSGFEEDGMTPEDQTVFIAGAGVDLDLGRHFKIDIKARDYMFSSDELADVQDPDEITHNWIYSAGLTFGFGGGPGREEIEEIGRERWGEEPTMAEKKAEAKALPDTTAKPDTAAPDTMAARKPTEPPKPKPAPEEKVAERKAAPDTAGTASDSVEKEVMAKMKPGRAPGEPEPETMASAVRTYQGDRVVVLPVPTVGEIYVRYGQPGAVKIESKFAAEEGAATMAPAADTVAPAPLTEEEIEMALREAVQKELQKEMPPADTVTYKKPAAMDSVQLQKQLSRFEKRLLEKIDRRMERQMEVAAVEPAEKPRTVVITPEPEERVEIVEGRGLAYRRTFGYFGGNVDEPEQFVLGLRMEMGPVANKRSLDFLPEVSVGISEETSLLIAANVRWSLGEVLKLRTVNPYVYGAPGLLFFSEETDQRDKAEGILNFGYGIAKDYDDWTFFLEHQGVDIFSLHRILAGVNLGF
jgi:hypothetical protein